MTIYVSLTVNFIRWTLVGMLFSLVFCQSPSRLSINGDSSQMACPLPGSVGPGGVPGASGSPGTIGLMGPPGKDGPDGSDGIKGAKGVSGDSGRPGNQGKPGVKGRKGSIGKTGPSGQVGQSGASGEKGQRGAKGERGDGGEPGPPGRCNCGRPARSAFSVAVTKSSPKEHHPIHFSRILLNEGNNYNTSTGKFVCVTPGVYYFSYDITIGNKNLAIGLVHNGEYRIRTLDTNSGNHDVASGSSILRLQRSDQVWLQIFNYGNNGLFFDPFWTDSTFTGFLIYAEQDYLNEADRKSNAKDSRQ